MRSPHAKLFFAASLCLAAALYPCWAFATYVFNTVDYPGATNTILFGINNSGQLVGEAAIGNGPAFGFVYGATGFAPLPPVLGSVPRGASGINDAGVIVGAAGVPTTGNVGPLGFILNGGTYALFSQPGWANTEARGINNSGLVPRARTKGRIYDQANLSSLQFCNSFGAKWNR